MGPGYALKTLLRGLALSLLGPVCQAASLGLTVAVVPLESDGGQTVGGSRTRFNTPAGGGSAFRITKEFLRWLFGFVMFPSAGARSLQRRRPAAVPVPVWAVRSGGGL